MTLAELDSVQVRHHLEHRERHYGPLCVIPPLMPSTPRIRKPIGVTNGTEWGRRQLPPGEADEGAKQSRQKYFLSNEHKSEYDKVC